MRLYGTLDVLEFQNIEYNAAIRARITEAFKMGIRAFVAVAVPLVPVDTGMARGSFLNLGHLVNMQININPKTGKPKTYYGPGGQRMPKTPQSGASLSTPEDEILKVDRDKVTFTFSSGVFHYTLNDFFGLRSNNGFPWNSFANGRIAFMQAVRDVKLFPDIKEYMLKSTITFGQGTDIRSPKIRLRQQKKVKS